jgi:hypothetical protein
MATGKRPLTKGKLVWRISADNPMGGWVDPGKLDVLDHFDLSAEFPELPEVSSGSRVDSSFDLLRGTDISEDDAGDTVPSDLLDELFAPIKKAPI